VIAVRDGIVTGFPAPISIPELWTSLVPEYRSRNYGQAIFTVLWDPILIAQIEAIRTTKVKKRCDTYLIPDELERVRNRFWGKSKNVGIRFGFEKTGRGYNEERGDYCLLSGNIDGKHFTAHYRSLEMISGFAPDLCLINKLPALLNLSMWKTVTFVTDNCFIFGLKDNSGEQLYYDLRELFDNYKG
jgi:hypothetical protein